MYVFIGKPLDQLESEKYDRENFIPCLKCNFIIPLDSLDDHFCTPKNKREELLKRSKFSEKTSKEFPSVITQITLELFLILKITKIF